MTVYDGTGDGKPPTVPHGAAKPVGIKAPRRVFIMRIDKFLKVSRILKRRTVSKEACNGGKVLVGGKEVKPAYSLKVGDEVEVRFGSGSVKFRVLCLKETVRKEEADSLYEIIT